MRMKTLLNLLVLMGVAVAVAMLMGTNDSVVSLYWPPYRIDLSFNMAVLMLGLLLTLVVLAFKANDALRQLPVKAHQWRLQQNEKALQQALFDAMAHWLAGRYVRAQKSAQEAIDLLKQSPSDRVNTPDQRWAMVQWIGAEAAHALGQTAQRDQLLAKIVDTLNPKAHASTLEGIRLRAAHWALQDRRPAQAQAHLNALPQGVLRRIQALRLRLKLARQERQPAVALDLVRQLVKAKAYSQEAAASVIRALLTDGLRQAHDADQLAMVWRKLSAPDQARPELLQAYLRRMNELKANGDDGVGQLAARAAQDVVKACETEFHVWPDDAQEHVMVALTPLVDQAGDQHLQAVESLHSRYPRNPALSYLLGQLCLNQQLWGKAQNHFQLAQQQAQTPALRHLAWVALAALAEQRDDAQEAARCWREAALVNV